ncbi:MAG TPA: glycosyltransferase family 39 protein, partial [Candidatus Binatus sp.]|nr:glycosyltransferase family 39 protein [Candidatus Binatus sp.]
MSGAREALLVVVGCAVLYLTGAADIPFYTRGEPREGLVVREMLRTGEWLVPARPDGETARKPPLYYWAAAASARFFTRAPELALRLPSAMLAIAAVLGTWATARAVWGTAAGLPAALVLATSFEWTRAATSARVDMALAASLTAVLCAWVLSLAGKGRGWPVLAAAGMALGTLAKGPVALVLPALAAGLLLVTRRDIRPLRAGITLAAATAVAGAWYVAAFMQTGSSFLDVVARENWLRFVDTAGAGTGHEHGPAYLLPLGLVGLLPWTPLVPLAFVPARERPRPAAVALAGAWVVVGLVFFSLAAAKRSTYLLPLYPAIALLIGAGVAAATTEGRLERAARLGAALYVPGALVLAGV